MIASPRRTGVRTLRGVLAALALALGFAAATALPAHAADDQIDSFAIAIAYDMRPSGVLHVRETITWRFGDSSGRRGIQRDLVQREPYGSSDNDVVYDISNIEVTTPDRVATQHTASTSDENGGRTAFLNLRIGDPDKTISAPTVTYVIDYDVAGAMRTSGGYDEFYWDGPGFGNPAIRNLTMRVTVPGGAQDASCFVGPPGQNQKTPCQTKNVRRGGPATFAQQNLPAGQGVSIGVKITSGLVADNRPHLQPDASKLSSGQQAGLAALGVAGVASLVGAPLVGLRWWRRHGRDQRYAGLAPGTVPLAGQTAHVVPNDPDIPIPVAFSPPHIPVAEAGLLIDGQVDTRETAGTIIDLAVRGALRVESQGDDDFRVTLLDPDRATAPHEMVLLTALFSGQPPGATVDLSTQGSLTGAHKAMQTSVIN